MTECADIPIATATSSCVIHLIQDVRVPASACWRAPRG
jgi:hypothetical protein